MVQQMFPMTKDALCAALEASITLAARGHRRKRDKSGLPVILHPLAVMAAVGNICATQEESLKLKIVAVLHDLLEDTDMTEEVIRQFTGADDELIDAVKACTRWPGEKYTDFITRIMKNSLGRQVKMADLRHNLSRAEGIEDLSERTGLVARWTKALERLEYRVPPIPDRPDPNRPTHTRHCSTCGLFDYKKEP